MDKWEGLRKALETATPGERYYEGAEAGGRVLLKDERQTIIHEPPCSPHNPQAIGDAMLIAAANPSAIADLLAERDRLAAEVVHFAGRLAGAERDRDQFKHQWEMQCGVAKNAAEKLLAANTELAEARRDAQRYRWLRQRVGVDYLFGEASPYLPTANSRLRPESTDEVIDRAMGTEPAAEARPEGMQ